MVDQLVLWDDWGGEELKHRGRVRWLTGYCVTNQPKTRTDRYNLVEWLNEFFKSYGSMKMAKAQPVKKFEKSEWKGFADVKLSLEQDAAFDTWELSGDDILNLLGDTVSSGYKFSLAWNEQNETFVASFTGGKHCGGNNGYTLSAFAGRWDEAIALLAFKHNIVCEGDWTSSVGAVRAKRG